MLISLVLLESGLYLIFLEVEWLECLEGYWINLGIEYDGLLIKIIVVVVFIEFEFFKYL